jgi:hypothetical protein
MWTYILGPLICIFPKPWRESFPFSSYVEWGRATTISGLMEMVAGLIALSYWYSYAMTAWVAHGVASALSGSTGPGVEPQAIGAVALTIWATHPLTWLLAYVGMEGGVRLCAAAFADSYLGILPLFLFDRIFLSAFRRKGAPRSDPKENPANHLSSVWGAVRERAMVAKLPLVSDELCFRKSGSEEILEVFACRRKDNWDPPRVVRYHDAFYRLEAGSMAGAPRPFHYVLRRLPTGVPGRTVLLYSPSDAVIRNGDQQAAVKMRS